MRVRSGVNRGASWIAGASVHGCWLGTYEAEKQQLLARLVRPGMTAWDVGANAGFYSLAFSRLVGTHGRVYGFEPLAENAANFLAHVRLNHARNVVLVQSAMGATDGTAGFEVAASNAMGRLSPDVRSYLVPCLTVDTFIERNPDSVPDLIKVDIEGGESALFEGGVRFFRKHSPMIVLSLHGEEQARHCTGLLKSLGYALSNIDGAALAEGAMNDEIQAHRRPGPAS
ncbi:MAG: FkbM family methyltransferase [Gammaproteobacteria bacterium]